MPLDDTGPAVAVFFTVPHSSCDVCRPPRRSHLGRDAGTVVAIYVTERDIAHVIASWSSGLFRCNSAYPVSLVLRDASLLLRIQIRQGGTCDDMSLLEFGGLACTARLVATAQL